MYRKGKGVKIKGQRLPQKNMLIGKVTRCLGYVRHKHTHASAVGVRQPVVKHIHLCSRLFIMFVTKHVNKQVAGASLI